MRLVLLAFSPFSRFVCRAKRALYSLGILRAGTSPIPVISVGNIAFGGSGKTPLAMKIAEILLAAGEKPALVSRGYRGAWESRGGVLSDGQTIRGTWREGGDEPYMAALGLPRAGVFVGKDRLASCREAARLGFSCAILDDGFQHLRLARDIDIVVFDPEEKLALREGLSSLKRAGFILIRQSGGKTCLEKFTALFPEAVAAPFRTKALGFVGLGRDETLPGDAFRDRRVFAFCGIAGPRRFFSFLEAGGARIAGRLAYPDHFGYPGRALARIAASARSVAAEAVITTEKDAVKIPPAGLSPSGIPVYFLRIGLELESEFVEGLQAALGSAKAGHGARA